ncbi:uncharacterized protein LOC106057704 isoform X1 [Biomphalaria glabrata]|uniref:Uncharacterized protein LOC106057704 isoform X1 n=1 Tax=Biomphalaria glabrata TaxID=6526 RepID=A0A9W3AX86_BIOGL|nr:uncharacterized protein LOC106057704 isoform X1 [Biomphalaria glabrata]XP_055891842.1 uncharacterized protein LOC106057704 isoform X1 [Biomphalaria glabrata]KAI8762045.1 hypothetical protein BgiMline_004981 [Biomphalaria glabrata]
MQFSVLGKDINISIPGNKAPVENGRGTVWENAMLSSQPTYNSTVKAFTSWYQYLRAQSTRKLLGDAASTTPKRSIVLNGSNDDIEVKESPPSPSIKVHDSHLVPLAEEMSNVMPDSECPITKSESRVDLKEEETSVPQEDEA